MTAPEQPEWDDRQFKFELLMPFLAVESKGGPYDDQAFTAGYQMGNINGLLEDRRIAATTFIIYQPLKEQADLIAMRFGYTMEVLHDDSEEWMQVGYTRIEDS